MRVEALPDLCDFAPYADHPAQYLRLMIKIIRWRALAAASPVAALILMTALLVPQDSHANVSGKYEKRNADYKWRLCPHPIMVPVAPTYSDADADTESTEVRADSARLLKDGVSQFSGDVEVVHGENALRADVVTYDSVHDLFNAEGRAHVWDANITWEGGEALYDLHSKVSDLADGRFWIQEGRGRGHAQRLHLDRVAKITELEGVEYSTCPLSDEAWRISASKIRLNHITERGSATNAVLRVHDIPVFYFPYVSFPISDERKSGFLTPIFGTSSRSGFDVRQPYYINIAPNQDATVTTRFTSTGGLGPNHCGAAARAASAKTANVTARTS